MGSTTLQTTASGQYEGHQFRAPFGQPWASGGSLATDLQYTGQRSYEGGAAPLGSLLDYGARSYSPVLGKFLQADTIIPGAGDPQSFNRYSYTRNNPLKYIDPTGHAEQCEDEDSCGDGSDPPASVPDPDPSLDSGQSSGDCMDNYGCGGYVDPGGQGGSMVSAVAAAVFVAAAAVAGAVAAIVIADLVQQSSSSDGASQGSTQPADSAQPASEGVKHYDAESEKRYGDGVADEDQTPSQ